MVAAHPCRLRIERITYCPRTLVDLSVIRSVALVTPSLAPADVVGTVACGGGVVACGGWPSAAGGKEQQAMQHAGSHWSLLSSAAGPDRAGRPDLAGDQGGSTRQPAQGLRYVIGPGREAPRNCPAKMLRHSCRNTALTPALKYETYTLAASRELTPCRRSAACSLSSIPPAPGLTPPPGFISSHAIRGP